MKGLATLPTGLTSAVFLPGPKKPWEKVCFYIKEPQRGMAPTTALKHHPTPAWSLPWRTSINLISALSDLEIYPAPEMNTRTMKTTGKNIYRARKTETPPSTGRPADICVIQTFTDLSTEHKSTEEQIHQYYTHNRTSIKISKCTFPPFPWRIYQEHFPFLIQHC